jgi:hypothetical protein
VAPPNASRIARALADAATRWSDADFPPRVRATRALVERTGYSEPVVEFVLDRLFEGLTFEALRATIESELGSFAALDGFAARPGRPDVYYRAIPRALIVSSDTTIGVAIPHLAFALCAGAEVTVKDRDDGLVGAFAETLFEEEPALRERLHVGRWNGASESAQHLARAGVVVAFGGAEALASIRVQLPADARFVPFGHRTSAGYVTRETTGDPRATEACARAAARDALLADGEGCLSLKVLFVESADEATRVRFRRALDEALEAAAIEFPLGARDLDPQVASYRARTDFRRSQGRDAPLEEPPPLLPRTLALYAVEGPEEALAFIERHGLPLEAFAMCAGARPDVLAVAERSGAMRITQLGQLQDPPLAGNHGGEGRILPFVRAMYRDR